MVLWCAFAGDPLAGVHTGLPHVCVPVSSGWCWCVNGKVKRVLMWDILFHLCATSRTHHVRRSVWCCLASTCRAELSRLIPGIPYSHMWRATVSAAAFAFSTLVP